MLEGSLYIDERRKQLVEIVNANDGQGDHFVCLVAPYASDEPPYWTRWSFLSDRITNEMEILAWASKGSK